MKKTPKRLFPPLCIAILAASSPAWGTSISQPHFNHGYNIFVSTSSGIMQDGVGQTFTATASHYDAITVFPYAASPNPADTTLQFTLFNGSFDAPIFTFTATALDTLGGSGLSIDVSSLTFNEGNRYSFALFNDSSDWLVFCEYGSKYTEQPIYDPYSDGHLYANMYDSMSGSYVFGLSSTRYIDLKFEINASESDPQPTPLPSTLALFSSGFLGLLPTTARKLKRKLRQSSNKVSF